MSTPPTTDRILVPLDGTWVGMAAMPWLRAIATDATELVLLRAVSLNLPVAGYGAMPAETYDILQQRAYDAAETYLDAVIEELADLSTNITKVVRGGTATDVILAVAEEHPVTMILMATEGRGATGRFFVGSVADRVARTARVPVMLVPARAESETPLHEPAPVGRIVVPFDGSDLARNAFPVAADLARHLGVKAHLARVVPTAEQMVANPADQVTGGFFRRAARAVPGLAPPSVDRAWYDGYVRSIRQALASEASKLAASAAIEADSETRLGEPVPMLLEMLAPDDVVVMTSHGESGVRRWLIGSVAEQLVREAIAPVMLVPSPGRERITA